MLDNRMLDYDYDYDYDYDHDHDNRENRCSTIACSTTTTTTTTTTTNQSRLDNRMPPTIGMAMVITATIAMATCDYGYTITTMKTTTTIMATFNDDDGLR